MDRDPMEYAELYERFVTRSSLSDRTAEAYSRRVRQFMEFIASDPQLYEKALNDEHVRDFAVRDWRRRLLTSNDLTKTGKKLSESTVQQHMTAVTSFYEWLGMGKPAGTRVEVPKAKKEGLAEDDLRKLMRAAKVSGERNYALVATLAYAGLRVGEAAALDVDDVAITKRTGQMAVRYGKGGKPRKVPINGALRAALSDWLDVRPGDRHTGPLWITTTGGRRLAQRTMQETVTKLGASVGLSLSPHTLRHTFARRMAEAGVPLPDIQELAGHASMQTTAGYTQPTAASLEHAVEQAAVDL